MGNNFLGQILGSVFSSAMAGRRGASSPAEGSLGGLGGGGLGGILGSVLGGGRGAGLPMRPGGGLGGLGGLGGGRGALLAMMLPLAMQWVQRNGGIGNVLKRFQQQGYGPQAQSWISTGDNEAIDPQAMDQVIGTEELSRLSQQLGVPQQDVASGFAEILPEMVNHLTPEGDVPGDADDVLDGGLSSLQQAMREINLP